MTAGRSLTSLQPFTATRHCLRTGHSTYLANGASVNLWESWPLRILEIILVPVGLCLDYDFGKIMGIVSHTPIIA
ncbi:hypothetical protein PVAG01_01806 [Phlyctema vagabunda]|uniref:Uncharacterized protein n=1 Tax=Phlyctema vagabunda TaxID=108571 RepID=A0ABR4PY58_9HELO